MRQYLPRKARLLAVALIITAGAFSFRAAAADAPVAPELQVADQFLLAIPKSGFGKDYLFSASMIPQGGSPTSHGLAGKIVRFQLYPDGVDMYESTKGLVVTEDLPARRLLASFPIVRQDGDRVVIDFNKGMRRVFTQSWTDGGGLDLDAARLRCWRCRTAAYLKCGRMATNWSSGKASRPATGNMTRMSQAQFEARYFIAPYQPGNFSGKEPNVVDDRYAKFFESPGQLELGTGRVSSRIDRFDLKQPVVFYYSANTPPDYVQAVKDAILYWNLAFGKEVVQAKKAPEGVTAPDAKYNVIQWVPWDNAGFAYADVLADPLNGESQHGQVYLTSTFAIYGKARARALLRAMEETPRRKRMTRKPRRRDWACHS